MKQAINLARNNHAPLKILVICPDISKHLPDHKVKFEEPLLEQTSHSVRSAKEALKLEGAPR